MESKVGIILASHGSYCYGAKDSLEMIIGPCPNLICVSVAPSMNTDDVQQQMQAVCENLHKDCDEILIFTDLLCGTPNNIAVRLMMCDDTVTVVTGYNLALLVELVNRRNNSTEMVTELLVDAQRIMDESLRIMKKEEG